ncbi:MAG TPA: hypothetical protein DCS66_23170 [Flavobacteriaceae bacterium]|nr:hypothetical protein [Flavobacteriaceae bacterium]
MKIIMILATGTFLSFPTIKGVNPDCYSQGYAILQKLAIYQGSGPNQAWILKDSNIEIGGWYCQ